MVTAPGYMTAFLTQLCHQGMRDRVLGGLRRKLRRGEYVQFQYFNLGITALEAEQNKINAALALHAIISALEGSE
jgi:hypothetical protein